MTLDKFIGIPYQDRGSSFAGCDCWGLVWLFYAEHLHQLLPRYEGYSSAEQPNIGEYISDRWDAWQSVGIGSMEPGDVLALRIARLPVHCGVFIGNGRMLHVMEGRMSCIEEVNRGFWRNAIVRIGRWKS